MSVSAWVKNLPEKVDQASAWLASQTPTVRTKAGQTFLGLVLVGPLTFVPTVWAAWTEPNIEALRTSTWALMIVVNFAAGLSVAHQGDWRMRLVSAMWIVMMFTVFIATLVR